MEEKETKNEKGGDDKRRDRGRENGMRKRERKMGIQKRGYKEREKERENNDIGKQENMDEERERGGEIILNSENAVGRHPLLSFIISFACSSIV